MVKKIRGINQKLSNLSIVLAGLPEKEKALDEKKKELDRLNKSLPELPAEDKKGQEELAALAELKKKFETMCSVATHRSNGNHPWCPRSRFDCCKPWLLHYEPPCFDENPLRV